MKTYSLLLLAGLLSVCAWSQQTINASLTHDGKDRSYILYVPDSYSGDTPVPLVLNFHGYTSNANDQMWYGDFRAIADTAGFLVVHPQGSLLNGITHWNVGGWTIGSTTDDVGFTEALLDELSTDYNIDQKRIYSTGMSNGGFMSFLLACQLSDRIAAIASVTGSMTPEIYNNCNPSHPTPVMQIHGVIDGVVPYFGATWTRSIADVLVYWRNYNNCSTELIKTDVPNTNLLDASSASFQVYPDGDNESTVEHFRISGGGHTWPGSFPSPGTNQDFNASLEIWKFFSRYDLDGLRGITSVQEQSSEEASLQIFPNPTERRVTVESKQAIGSTYQIHSIQGQLMKQGILVNKRQELDLSALPKGVYILRVGNQGFKLIKG
ncbi:MAG: T9SS type A sorting domain-containing protein [Saprospiraceae bacterium]|nr:T9SS type A sorting domain-containing protein [Saprospiraceae bacterium]